MKKFLLTVLVATAALTGYGWFLAPTYSIVAPGDSSLTYYGMPGKVSYKDGYNVGFQAGQGFGPVRLYASYDYTHFRAKGVEVMGFSVPSDELYQSHTVLANAEYTFPSVFGVKPFIGLGAGKTYNDVNSFVWQYKIGAQKRLFGFDCSLAYTGRFVSKDIVLAHKAIGQPELAMFQAALSHNF